MDLSKLNQGKRIVYVGFQGERIAVEYDVKGYDSTVYVEWARANKLDDTDPRKPAINNVILEHMITAWDLTDGCTSECLAHKNNGSGPICREHAVQVTPELIGSLPHLVRNQMVMRIMADVGADSDDPKLSAAS